MYNFIRGLLQRENKIIKYVAIAAFVLIFLNLMNKRYKTIQEENTQKTNEKYGNYTSVELSQKYDVITEFIEFCEKKDYKNAYLMISDDCKTYLYPSIEEFEEKYCKEYFEKLNYYSRMFERVVDDTAIYKTTFKSNSIETGLVETKVDYIGLRNDKIILSGFLKAKEMDTSSTDEIMSVKINKEYIFYDQEIFEMEIKNTGTKDIVFETENIKCEEDEYLIYRNFSKEEKITIKPNDIKKLEVKITKRYNGNSIKKVKILNITSGEEVFDMEFILE